jgi:hypothetical protein
MAAAIKTDREFAPHDPYSKERPTSMPIYRFVPSAILLLIISHAALAEPDPANILADAASYTVKVETLTSVALHQDEEGASSGTGSHRQPARLAAYQCPRSEPFSGQCQRKLPKRSAYQRSADPCGHVY